MKKFPRRFFNDRQAGFSLVEMIGVLAIIAILAVVIVPKVFSTIASSRVTNAVGSITSVKTAVSEFAGKYGTLPVIGGANVHATNARLPEPRGIKTPRRAPGRPRQVAEIRRRQAVSSRPCRTPPIPQSEIIIVWMAPPICPRIPLWHPPSSKA